VSDHRDLCQDHRLAMFLDRAEVQTALSGDLPASVLRRLEVDVRNDRIVNAWAARQEDWGKTLVFATRIEHADDLADRLLVRR
jgi:hypothetical protein